METRLGGTNRRAILAMLLVGAAAAAPFAGEDRAAAQMPQTPQAPAEAAPPQAAPLGDTAAADQGASAGPKITLDGYLTQAYAISDGNQFLGIPQGGTADYRTAAVQMRVDLTAADTFAIKLRHERIGDSPAQAFQEDVALDWLFYQHKFGTGAIKVGRVKIPFGLYNEVRDVGTLLPFYRLPADFYGVGSFVTETVDGAALAQSFDLGRGWTLDGDVYGGNFEYLAINSEVAGLDKSKARDAVGAELWINTPLPALRIGVGGMRFKATTTGVGRQRANIGHASLEWGLGRLAVHLEYKRQRIEDAKTDSGYAHAGVRLTDKLSANAQIEFSTLTIKEIPRPIHLDKDRALGLDYAFRRDLLLKVEGHWNRGFTADTLGGVPDLFAPPLATRYGIASLSVSF
jgi:hypothetical protein